ncbi:MAG: PEP-CTERM sorting domain-containing protein [Armatimonadota bacterium]
MIASVSSPASAGQGFFDDFDGEDLGGHWDFGNPKGAMFYSVHDSLLEVFGFAGFGNSDWIYAAIPQYGDFDLQATVGWTDLLVHETLSVRIGEDPRHGFVGGMAFVREQVGGEWVSRVVAAFGDGPRAERAAPSSGFHQFRVSRTGSTFAAYFDGQLLLQGSGTSRVPRVITLEFTGAHARPVDLLVDRVSVVPEPASIAWLAAGVAVVALRRRRTG